ncbi:MAG TPA: hypothetical protein VH062_02225 [Polyangiaceae bacterium]|nr:hypothetical protein [Polyangiaceae bacterium]
MKVPEGDLYVSSVEGHIVGRPGSGSPTTKPQWIGVRAKMRARPDGSQELDELEWLTDEVHLIPAADVQAHLKAWQTELAAGSLKLQTKEEFETFCKAQAEESASPEQKAELAKAEAAKAEAAKAEIVKGTLEQTETPLLGPADQLPGSGDLPPAQVAPEPAPAKAVELIDTAAEAPPVKARRRAGSE